MWYNNNLFFKLLLAAVVFRQELSSLLKPHLDIYNYNCLKVPSPLKNFLSRRESFPRHVWEHRKAEGGRWSNRRTGRGWACRRGRNWVPSWYLKTCTATWEKAMILDKSVASLCRPFLSPDLSRKQLVKKRLNSKYSMSWGRTRSNPLVIIWRWFFIEFNDLWGLHGNRSRIGGVREWRSLADGPESRRLVKKCSRYCSHAASVRRRVSDRSIIQLLTSIKHRHARTWPDDPTPILFSSYP